MKKNENSRTIAGRTIRAGDSANNNLAIRSNRMKTLYLRRRARELWDTPYNQRAWVRSVLQLKDKWLIHSPINQGD